MIKCQQCRANDVELLSSWERFKNWLFYKLFPEDIADLSQNKYTQGISDGYKLGWDSHEKAAKQLAKQLYNIDL